MKPPRENTLSQQIPVGSVLGGRYEITAHIIITAESDMVLEGTDQIRTRKVSVVVASPSRSALLEANSRALATNARGNIQILDLGITPEGSRYLVTSHTRPDTLLDTLLVENHALSNAEDALGTEIFGDSESGSSPTPTRRSLLPAPTRRASPQPRTGTHPTAQPSPHTPNPPASTKMTKTKKTAAAAPGQSPWQQSCCSSSSQAVSSPPWAQSAPTRQPHRTPPSPLSRRPNRLRQTPAHRHPRPLRHRTHRRRSRPWLASCPRTPRS